MIKKKDVFGCFVFFLKRCTRCDPRTVHRHIQRHPPRPTPTPPPPPAACVIPYYISSLLLVKHQHHSSVLPRNSSSLLQLQLVVYAPPLQQ